MKKNRNSESFNKSNIVYCLTSQPHF